MEDMNEIFVSESIKYYENFKMVCGTEWAQTKTLHEVYNFITAQLIGYSKIKKTIDFINILDGDKSWRTRDKFNYLKKKEKYKSIKNKVFIGDLYEFERFYNRTCVNI